MVIQPGYERERQGMVTWQIAARGIRDGRVLDVMRRIPRHCFVPADCQSAAYEDRPLPIGFGQTISQPYITALMTELLHLNGDEIVLEVGTGSGYQAAILACLVNQVHTIEFQPDLAERAGWILDELGLTNVTVHHGDGSEGLSAFAPYGGIIVTAAAPLAPQPLLDQLAVHGRMVIPVGSFAGQELQVWTRTPDGVDHEPVAPVVFVPLRGIYGWSEDDWQEFND